MKPFAIARDDEEGVVDADADADHRRETGSERVEVEEEGEDRDAHGPGDQPKEGSHDWQTHGDDRAESDEENDHRGGDRNQLRFAEWTYLLGLGRDLAARLDPESIRR